MRCSSRRLLCTVLLPSCKMWQEKCHKYAALNCNLLSIHKRIQCAFQEELDASLLLLSSQEGLADRGFLATTCRTLLRRRCTKLQI